MAWQEALALSTRPLRLLVQDVPVATTNSRIPKSWMIDWDWKNEKKIKFCSGMKETKKLLPKRTQHFQHGLILCRPLESRWTRLFSKQKGTFPRPKSPLELLELLPLKFVTLAGLPCLFFHRICLKRNIFKRICFSEKNSSMKWNWPPKALGVPPWREMDGMDWNGWMSSDIAPTIVFMEWSALHNNCWSKDSVMKENN